MHAGNADSDYVRASLNGATMSVNEGVNAGGHAPGRRLSFEAVLA